MTGPAIIAEANATTVVDNGWQATMTRSGHLLAERVVAPVQPDAGTEADPVLLEIFNNLFMSIAEQMGFRLEATAQSVNIRERLDFSCALFDPRRRPGRQCTAHSGTSRLDGRHRQGSHPPPGRRNEAR